MFGTFVFVFCLFQSAQPQNQSNLVLIGHLEKNSSQLELKCATSEIDKAITWDTPMPVIPSDFYVEKTIFVDQDTITLNDEWTEKSSYKRNFGLVLDERWESFELQRIYSSNRIITGQLDTYNFLPYPDALRNNSTNDYIPFSVKLEVQLNILLCNVRTYEEPNNCYVIILRSNGDVFGGTQKCAAYYGECQETYKQNYRKELTKDGWTHFTVTLDRQNHSISVVFEGDDSPLLHHENDNIVNDITQYDIGAWDRELGSSFYKFHQYNVYEIKDKEQNKTHLITSTFPTANSLCLSMYISICDTCSLALSLKQNLNNSVIYEEEYFKKKGSTWQKIKFSASGLDNEIGYSIFIKFMGTSEGTDEFLLSHLQQHKSRSCFQNELKYSSMKINATNQQNVSCRYLLNDPNDNANAVLKIQEPSPSPENACKADAVGSSCISCISIFKQQCESMIICQKNGCQCSQGYEGALCEVPLRDVWNVSWNSSDTTILLEWNAPTKSTGENIEYIVSYQHIKYLECFNEDKNSSGKITTTDTKILLQNLNPYSDYSVRIERSTKSPGETYEAQVTTKPGNLEEGVIEIIYKEINTTEVTLHYKRKCGKSKAELTFLLSLTCPPGDCDEKLWIYSFNPTFSLNLQAFTNYNLEYKEYGKETVVLTDSLKTKPGIPHRVTNFDVYENSKTSLLMRWTPGEPATGTIEKYSFSAQSEISIVDPIEIEAHECEVWTSMMCAEMSLIDVAYKTELVISIRAKNEDVDVWSIPTTTHTIFGAIAPEKPKVLYAMWDNGYNFTLRLQHPSKINERLQKFSIKDLETTYFGDYELPVDKYNLTYEITKESLSFHANYSNVKIAFNIWSEDPAVIVVLNPPKRPQINETVTYEEHMNNTIKIFIPAPIDVEYKSYSYVILSEPGATDCSQNKSASEFIKDFKECDVWFAKEVLNQNKEEEAVIGDKSRQYSSNLNETIINRALKPYTKYKLYIVVVNENNKYTRFNVTEGIPVYLEPTKIILPCYTSCKIRFKPKKDPQSSSNVYIIHYKEINHTSWTKTNNTLSFTNHSETLDVFKKSTSYNLRIYLVKGKKLEMQMPELNFTTSCQNIKLENITIVAKNISAYLYLNPDFEKDICDLKYYNLNVQIPGHEYNKTLKAFNRIESLKPLTAYNVSISSKNHSVFTHFTTDEGFPEKVENITWNSTKTTISLEWKEPRITNGKIRGYHISYQHSLYKSCIYIESDDDSSGKKTVKNNKIVLEKLNPNSNYTVSINAFTKLPGTLAETQVSTKPTDELNADAYKISIDEFDNTISLHFWPNCKNIKGPLLIGLMLTCSKSWCNETTNLTIDPLIINYHIRNLHPFTEYHLEFKLLNSARSIDLFSKTITTLTTQPRVPNPVTHFEIYGRSKDGLLLRWKPPEPPTGVIEDYFFSTKHYQDGIWTDLDFEDSKWGTCKDWPDLMCVGIKGVPNELKFQISITAKNQNVKTLSQSVTAAMATSFSLEEHQPTSAIYYILVIFTVILTVIVLLLIFYVYYVRKKITRRISAAGNMQVTYTSVEK